MMNCKKLLKNSKGISPIFATLILIAIAVIAGVVVYMFTSGTVATMTNGGTAGQEKITVQASSYSGSTITVILEQTSGPKATVNGLIVKDANGNTIGTATSLQLGGSSSSLTLTTGQLQTVTGTYSGLSSSTHYTVTVTTAAGGSFTSTQFLG